MARTYPTAEAFARAFVVTGSDPGPGRRVGRRGEGAPMRAQLRHPPFGYGLAHTGKGVQVRKRRLKREAGRLDLLVEGLDPRFEGIEEAEQVRENKALGVGEAARERLLQE